MRNPMLDVLRGVAVLLVFCYHSEGALLISRFGWTGVDLFFVLSGFLVSGLLFAEYQTAGSLRPGVFLMRRGLKIYPQFYLFLGATLSVALLGGARMRWLPTVAELGFFQNYTTGLWGHTWSLGVEEHFYLALTLGLVFLARRGGRNPFARLPLAIAVIALGVLGLRVATWLLGPVTEYRNVFPSHLRIDSLLCGVLLGYAHAFERDRITSLAKRWGTWLGPASIALLAPVAFLKREDPFMVTIGFSMVAWGFALLLVNVLYPAKPAEMGRGALAIAWLGRVSYAFYLWHGPVIVWTGQLVSLPPFAEMILTFVASCVIAALTTAVVERPVLALRDRWLPSRQQVTPVRLAA